MPIPILMPTLSPTMTEGNLARWLKQEGEEVHSGDILAEIETDKATMEVEAADDGRIGRLLVPEGAQGIKVNAPIAVLLGEGEDSAALAGYTAAAPPASTAVEAPIAGAEPAAVPVSPSPVPPPTGNGAERRLFASPLARRMAQQ